MSTLILRIVLSGLRRIMEEKLTILELIMLPRLGNLFQQTKVKMRIPMFTISIQILIQMLKQLLIAQHTARIGTAIITQTSTPVNLTAKESILVNKVREVMVDTEVMADMAAKVKEATKVKEDMAAKVKEDMAAKVVMAAMAAKVVMAAMVAMVALEDGALITMMVIKLQLGDSHSRVKTGGTTSEKISSMVWSPQMEKNSAGRTNSKRDTQRTRDL
jgi:hypothetical protein